MKNCYSAGTVSKTDKLTINGYFGYGYGTIAGSAARVPLFENCYGLSDEVTPNLIGVSDDGFKPIINDTASIILRSDSVLLASQVAVNGDYYNDLLIALNAWVDANDTSECYFLWEADTAGVNGGFPILLPRNKYVITFVNYDGSILQQDTLRKGEMPYYTGVTPQKPANSEYTHSFIGWMPEVTYVLTDAEYVAQYDSTKINDSAFTTTYSDDLIPQKIIKDGRIYVIRNGCVYTIQGQLISTY